ATSTRSRPTKKPIPRTTNHDTHHLSPHHCLPACRRFVRAVEGTELLRRRGALARHHCRADGTLEDVTAGWTSFAESADTLKAYVSSSTGNDANDGLSPGK